MKHWRASLEGCTVDLSLFDPLQAIDFSHRSTCSCQFGQHYRCHECWPTGPLGRWLGACDGLWGVVVVGCGSSKRRADKAMVPPARIWHQGSAEGSSAALDAKVTMGPASRRDSPIMLSFNHSQTAWNNFLSFFLKINVAVSTKTPKFFATTAGRLCHGCTSFLSHVPYIPHHFFVLYQSLFSSLDFTFSLIGYPCGVCSCQLPQGNSSHSAAVLSRFLLKTQTVTRSWSLLRGDFIPSVKHSKTLSLLRMNHVCSWYHVIYKSGWEKFTMRNPEFCGHLGMIPWILIVIPLMRIHLDKFHDISIAIA
jgi:hypothetical protein